ncbi:MAG: hypothetical protein ACLUEK_16840 [Oscillospiraceae bacterium]
MVFGARGYAVLLVSASEKFNSTLRGLLPAGEFWLLDASGAAQARRNCRDELRPSSKRAAAGRLRRRLALEPARRRARACCSSSRPRSMKRSAPRCWSRAS